MSLGRSIKQAIHLCPIVGRPLIQAIPRLFAVATLKARFSKRSAEQSFVSQV
jgi:hypothetical protein